MPFPTNICKLGPVISIMITYDDAKACMLPTLDRKGQTIANLPLVIFTGITLRSLLGLFLLGRSILNHFPSSAQLACHDSTHNSIECRKAAGGIRCKLITWSFPFGLLPRTTILFHFILLSRRRLRPMKPQIDLVLTDLLSSKIPFVITFMHAI